jgi:predicted nucleotidyltransferase
VKRFVLAKNPEKTKMRLNRGDRIAGVDGLRLRKYFRQFGSDRVNYETVMAEFSVTKRQAGKMLADLLTLEMISRSFQEDKDIVCYRTTIKGNALGMAKAGKPIKRASADKILREFLDRTRAVNRRQELAHSVESVVVFGSYVSDAQRLNDLDIAVELKGKWHDDETFRSVSEASRGRARVKGRRFRDLVEEVGWPQLEVLSILKNRSRAISLCDLDSLVQMKDFRYVVVFGDETRIVGLLKGGQVVKLPIKL